MKVEKNGRGFDVLVHSEYPNNEQVAHPDYPNNMPQTRVVQQSSAIGDYEDSFDKPGSSYLWLGEKHHLNREEVAQVVEHLRHWLKTGWLDLNEE